MLPRLCNYFRFYLRHIQTFSSIIQEHARAYLLYLLYHGTIIWLCFPNDHMTVCSMTIFTHCNFTVTWRFQVYVIKMISFTDAFVLFFRFLCSLRKFQCVKCYFLSSEKRIDMRFASPVKLLPWNISLWNIFFSVKQGNYLTFLPPLSWK